MAADSVTVHPQAGAEVRSAAGVRGVAVMSGRFSPDVWALLAIAIAVLVANLPYLLGIVVANPLGVDGALARSVAGGWLNGTPTLDPNIGFSSQAIGHLAALDLLHLHLPWWNPYEATGMPLLGETQAAALFPPTLLTALSNGQLYEHVLLELVAGVSTYLLLRRLRVGRCAAGAAAIAFAVNGTFAWFAHATVNPVPFLPMLLLGIERAYMAAQAGEPGGWRVLALAGALSLYAGFPEVAYINALLGVCWIGWRCGCLGRGEARAFLVKAALGGAAAALLAAPVLVASGDYLSRADLGAHASAQLGHQHLGAYALAQLVMPYAYGQLNADLHGDVAQIWMMVGGYLSSSIVLFALLGACARGRRGLRIVLLAWAVLVASRIYGQPPGLGHVLGILPDMSRIAFFRYGTSSFELAAIILAAIGLDDVIQVPEHRRRVVWGALAAVLLVAAGVLAAWPIVHPLGTRFAHRAALEASVAWAVAVAVAAVLASVIPRPRLRAALLGGVLAADALALFMVPVFSAPRAETLDLAPVAYLRSHLGDGRFFTLGPIQPNYGSYFALGSLNINDLPPASYSAYVHSRLDPVVDPGLFVGTFGGWRRRDAPSPAAELSRHLNGYRAAGVRYVVTPGSATLPQGPRTFSLVFRDREARIYRLAGASSYVTAAGCRTLGGDRAEVTVFCRQPSTLVRRETWFPGWSATVDGHPVTVRRSGLLFQAVRVPAGRHRIAFAFAPAGIHWALAGLLAGCVLLGAPTIRRRRA